MTPCATSWAARFAAGNSTPHALPSEVASDAVAGLRSPSLQSLRAMRPWCGVPRAARRARTVRNPAATAGRISRCTNKIWRRSARRAWRGSATPLTFAIIAVPRSLPKSSPQTRPIASARRVATAGFSTAVHWATPYSPRSSAACAQGSGWAPKFSGLSKSALAKRRRRLPILPLCGPKRPREPASHSVAAPSTEPVPPAARR